MPHIIQTLTDRGLLDNITDPALADVCQERPVRIYVGFDPSAPMLHCGSLVPILLLKRFQMAGHRPIALVGGGTGLIGDPSGKRAERTLQTADKVRENADGIRDVLGRWLDFDGPSAAVMLNNLDWLGKLNFLEFLRDTGKYFRINDMIAKESVSARLNSEVGISFTEFSYMLLQAYDFKHLHDHHQCEVQGGGSDQWGNITMGTELIRRTSGGKAYGITVPLLTTASGQKFGKTEKGAIWLDAEWTRPYDFYQYWVRTDDRDVEKMLRTFTFLPMEEIGSLIAHHEKDPSHREAQKKLAFELTAFIHGEEEARKAESASVALFSGKLDEMSDERLEELFPDVPSIEKSRSELEDGLPLLDVLVDSGLVSSKKEGKRLLAGGGIYLNQADEALPPEKRSLDPGDLAGENSMILRAGKKKYCLLKFS